MPTFPSIEAYNRALDSFERDLERKYRDMGRKIAEGVKPEGYRAAAADLGGDPKFSGWRPWLELKVRTKPWGAVIHPTRYSAGPWTVAEFGRNTMAGPRTRIDRRTGNTRQLKRGGVSVVRNRNRWNGVTAGKSTASDASSRFERASEPIAEREYRVVLRRHFDVT